MLPFFRKIRFQLAQDNQFLKYSRYAIGEIAMVVVGVLIALQINNWNENRKDNEKKLFYIQLLQEDLMKDTAQIKQFIRQVDHFEPIYRNFKLISEKKDATIDTLINLFIDPNTNTYTTPKLSPQNDSSLKSLLSTGDIKVFDKYQSSQILDFYEDTERGFESIHSWYNETMRIVEQFWLEYGWLTKKYETNSNWFIYERSREKIDEIKFSIEFDVYITRRNFWLPVMRQNAENLLKKTNAMLETVQSMQH